MRLVADDLKLGIGESPLWDRRRGWLWFVDILPKILYALDPLSGTIRHFEMPSSIGSVALADDCRLVVALRNGIHLYDCESGLLELLVHPEPEMPCNRLNDGKAGPDGAFWVGSMSEAQPYEPTGRLYRVRPSGEVTVIREALYVSNGLDWSPDGRTMYHADSVPGTVMSFAFDPDTGAATHPMEFATLVDPHGHPDGAAVDSEGCYWVTGVSAGRLNRLSPGGKVLASIPLPCAAPTMACFGGDDLRTLFVTSLTRGREHGHLYAMEVDITGLPPFLFGSGERSS